MHGHLVSILEAECDGRRRRGGRLIEIERVEKVAKEVVSSVIHVIE